MPKEKAERPVQPLCGWTGKGSVCRHSLSFHGKDKARCRALGCHCPGFVAQVEPQAATA